LTLSRHYYVSVEILNLTPVGTAGFEPVGYKGVGRIGKPFLGFLVGMWWV